MRRAIALARQAIVLMTAATVSACAGRTIYTAPPVVPAPAEFRENANWKPSQPQDAVARGEWWETFGRPDLNALETQIDVSNETLKIAAARFAEARAAVRGARSQLYPQVTASPSISRANPSGNRPTTIASAGYGDFIVPFDATYEADVWGRVRSSVNASSAAAQATAADLEAVRLSLHAELAVDYFTLRAVDREARLLAQAVAGDERAFELTSNRFRGGIVSQADVDQAETQLESTRAQMVDVQVDRALFEHAIAVLVGVTPSSFTIAPEPLDQEPPAIPVGLPSELLERRPDIAAAERRMAEAGAEVGVTQAAFYPVLTLSGSVGFEAASFGRWLAGASNFWSVAPALLVNVFDAGRRKADFEQAKAAYTEVEASYRLSVLGAFREVEDQLATLRLLEDEASIQARATAAAERSLAQANNRYQGGVVTYLEVITAQSRALENERADVSILSRRMAASVQLLKALGGGWNVSQLPADVSGTK
jgi:NodT family efflux transporter outer membrane factor (OMF) lipoprotein